MAYTDIVLRRLRLLVSREYDIPLAQLGGGNKLGEPPIGLAGGGLTALRQRLNGEAVGFADVLETSLSGSDITGSKKLSEVQGAIKTRSWVKHLGEYRSMVQEVVRKSLSQRILEINPTAEIAPAVQIPALVGEANVPDLRVQITEDLKKYLFLAITLDDLRRSFASSRARIVGKTLIF